MTPRITWQRKVSSLELFELACSTLAGVRKTGTGELSVKDMGIQGTSAIPPWSVHLLSLQRRLGHEGGELRGLSRVLWRWPANASGDWFCRLQTVITLFALKTTDIVWCPLQRGNPVPLSRMAFSSLH